eukprot:10808419-Alexandrium_andersonii.AAC.1
MFSTTSLSFQSEENGVAPRPARPSTMLTPYASCACGSKGGGYMRNMWFLHCSSGSIDPIDGGAR